MADIIVQPKVLNADGTTYDNLIMQNAVNAIKNADGTYSGFTQDTNRVLQLEDEIIQKEKLLWNGSYGGTTAPGVLNFSSFSVVPQVGDTLKIVYSWANTSYWGNGCIVPAIHNAIKYVKIGNLDEVSFTESSYNSQTGSNLKVGLFICNATLSVVSSGLEWGHSGFQSAHIPKCICCQESGSIVKLGDLPFPVINKIYKIIE